MNDQILNRLRNKEDSLTERKPEGVNNSELRKELVAFANSVTEASEAIIFIGVSDDGEILGVNNTDSLQKKVRKAAETECYPPIATRTHVVTEEGKSILAVTISHSSKKPHFAGPAYVRRGSECVNASDEEYEDLINSRSDKCRRILNQKDQIFTVTAQNKKLGATKRSNGTWHHECRIESCDQHSIRLFDIGLNKRFSESMSDVKLMYDEEKHRPKLVIEYTGT